MNISLTRECRNTLDFSDAITQLKRVEVLVLTALRGPFPPMIGDMASLRHLEIRRSFITGLIPSSFRNLERLEAVIFTDIPELAGLDIKPTASMYLPNLLIFRVSDCPAMISKLPQWLYYARNLRVLELSNAHFHSDVSILSTFPNITRILFQQSGTYGKIDDYFWRLPLLESIFLAQTRTYLSFGAPITGLTNLISMRIISDHTYGFLPPSIDKMVSLRYLSLAQCSFYGSIPDSIGSLTKLKSLTINGIHFDGTIPESLGNLSNLETLSIRGTLLSGTLPASLERLSPLFSLDISDNPLEGSLPNIPFSSDACMQVTINNNLFSGPIPRSLARYCHYIDLSSNRFGP